MKTRLFPIAILFLPLSLCSFAQQNKLAVMPPEPLMVKRGTPVKQQLKVTVLNGFHVNSDKPKDEFLIPLKLTWDAGALEAKSIVYPKPEELMVGGDNLVVFTGKFVIETSFEPAKSAAAGSTTLTGKLRYQACNTQMCFRPASIDIKLPVVVE